MKANEREMTLWVSKKIFIRSINWYWLCLLCTIWPCHGSSSLLTAFFLYIFLRYDCNFSAFRVTPSIGEISFYSVAFCVSLCDAIISQHFIENLARTRQSTLSKSNGREKWKKNNLKKWHYIINRKRCACVHLMCVINYHSSWPKKLYLKKCQHFFREKDLKLHLNMTPIGSNCDCESISRDIKKNFQDTIGFYNI